MNAEVVFEFLRQEIPHIHYSTLGISKGFSFKMISKTGIACLYPPFLLLLTYERIAFKYRTCFSLNKPHKEIKGMR
jgi:hypothetical protein